MFKKGFPKTMYYKTLAGYLQHKKNFCRLIFDGNK